MSDDRYAPDYGFADIDPSIALARTRALELRLQEAIEESRPQRAAVPPSVLFSRLWRMPGA
jgi:hypothetical protein